MLLDIIRETGFENKKTHTTSTIFDLQINDELTAWSFVALSNYVVASTSARGSDPKIHFAAMDGDLFFAYAKNNAAFYVQIMSDGTVIDVTETPTLVSAISSVTNIIISDLCGVTG